MYQEYLSSRASMFSLLASCLTSTPARSLAPRSAPASSRTSAASQCCPLTLRNNPVRPFSSLKYFRILLILIINNTFMQYKCN